MKKTIKMVLLVVMAALLNCSIAFAGTGAELAGTGAGVASYLYKMNVVNQMVGRAGSSLETGAKGIAFEVMYKDLMNLKDALKPGVKTSLSVSSIDPVNDLITTAADGSVIRGIQCKAGVSESFIKSTFERVANGDYADASLVGTKECAKAFNEAAAKAGSTATMESAPISNKVVQEIADMSLGNMVTAADALKHMGRNAILYTVLEVGVSGVESVINGDPAEKVISHMTVGGAKGALVGVTGSVACDVAKNALILIGAGSAATKVVPMVIMIGSTMLVAYVLDNVAEETGLEAVIADAVKSAGETIKAAAETVKEKTVEVAEIVGNKAEKAVDAIKVTANNAVSATGEAAEKAAETAKETFGKAKVATENALNGIGEFATNTAGKAVAIVAERE